MTSEVRGRNRPCKPILPTHPNIVPEPWDKKETTYIMTAEERAAVIAKYGEPILPLSSRRRPMQAQRPPGKKGKG